MVFGASSGIGKATSIFLSTLGARIVLIGRREEKLLETIRNMNNPDYHIIKILDLLHTEDIPACLKEIVQQSHNKLDGFVYSAGVHHFTPLRSLNMNKLQELWTIHLNSLIQILATFSNRNISHDESSIVLLSSISAERGEPGIVGYSAAKGAINSIVKSAAVELSSRKIRINSILPGIVQTEMSQKIQTNMNEDQYNTIKNKHLLGLGIPEDIAYGIGYLLSPAARWVTGTNMVLDGGYSL